MAASPLSRDARAEFAQWQLEKTRVEALLHSIEETERAILATLRCPPDPVAIYDILVGKHAAPWPTRDAAYATQQARHAMFVLVWLRNVRASLDKADAPLSAIEDALLIGLYASHAAVQAARAVAAADNPQRGGKARGAMIAKTAARYDAHIRRYVGEWRASEDDLQDKYPQTPVPYIDARLRGVADLDYPAADEAARVRFIQRRLERLGLGLARQRARRSPEPTHRTPPHRRKSRQ